jgi:CBS-domain-containing membrane protein
VVREPLDPAAAKVLIRAILTAGTATFSRHALDELRRDDLTTVDVVNALRVVTGWRVGR